jgi:hypothetical protein
VRQLLPGMDAVQAAQTKLVEDLDKGHHSG